MSLEYAPNERIDIATVIGEAEALKARLMAMGNIDSEFDTIRKIVARMQAGTLTPPEAMTQLLSIEHTRIER
jgi:hypothetical protein